MNERAYKEDKDEENVGTIKTTIFNNFKWVKKVSEVPWSKAATSI